MARIPARGPKEWYESDPELVAEAVAYRARQDRCDWYTRGTSAWAEAEVFRSGHDPDSQEAWVLRNGIDAKRAEVGMVPPHSNRGPWDGGSQFFRE